MRLSDARTRIQIYDISLSKSPTTTGLIKKNYQFKNE